MRCIQPDDGSPSPDGEGTQVVSVIAGDVFFGDGERNPDYQDAAFEAAMSYVHEVRESAGREIGNAIFMFDQAGPWDPFLLPNGSRRKKKKKISLDRLKPQFADPLVALLNKVGLPASFAEELETIPEEKLKFLFLTLARDRKLEIKALLADGMIVPKSFRTLPRGLILEGSDISSDDFELEIEEEDDDDEFDTPLLASDAFSQTSCSLIATSPGEAHVHTSSATFDDYLARCRAVAAALTVRAANLPDMEQADRVDAFYQFDPLAPNRVDPNVVTFGAEFAQKQLGLRAPVYTHFFVPVDPVRVTDYLTNKGVTEKLPK